MMKKTRTSIIFVVVLIIVGFGFFSTDISIAACPDNIIGYWKLDKPNGGGGYKDEIKNNTGTGIGDLDVATGIVKNAAVFNVTDTGIWIPPRSIFGWYSQESFSIEFWVKTPTSISPASTQVIIGRNDPSTGMQWWIGANEGNGNASMYMQDGSGNQAILVGVGKSLTDGEWHHVVAVRNGTTNNITLYVDGAVQGTPVSTEFPNGFASTSALITIGYLDVDPFYRFGGLVDEVAIYNLALSQAEISEHLEAGNSGVDYCGGTTPSSLPFPEETVGLWRLDETGGDTYVDSVGENDGTGNNSPSPAENGRVKGAQSFNEGESTGIDIGPSSVFGWFGGESFTIEFWTKTAAQISPSTAMVILGRDDDTTGMQWWVGANEGNGNASLYMQDGSGNQAILIGIGKSITDGQWHHVAAVRDGKTNDNMLYVDGSLQGSSVKADFPLGFASQTANLTIGYLNRSPFFRFNGLVDEVAVYQRALPQDEIMAHVEAGNNGNGIDTLKPGPAVDAGVDQEVEANTRVELAGTAAPGYDGTEITSYLWEQTDGTVVEDLTDANTANAYFTSPDVDAEETLSFKFTVTTDDGQSNSDTIDVTINATDETPPPSGDDSSSGCFLDTLF